MDMVWHVLYLFFVFPFEYIFLLMLKGCLTILPHGYALLAMSLAVNLLMFPITIWAKRIENREREKQFKVKQELIAIKKQYKGAEAFRMTEAVYKKYHYSVFLAFRSDLSVFLSIPLIIAAFSVLSDSPAFSNISFWMIEDLAKPDRLFFGYNFLPFLMTAVNLFSIKLYNSNKKFFDRANIKLIVIALLFLICLYGESSALMVYWTSNNIVNAVIIWLGLTNKRRDGLTE